MIWNSRCFFHLKLKLIYYYIKLSIYVLFIFPNYFLHFPYYILYFCKLASALAMHTRMTTASAYNNICQIHRWCHGSPVHRYGLYALQWIVEINGKPTPNLDAFVDVTKVWKYCARKQLAFVRCSSIFFV